MKCNPVSGLLAAAVFAVAGSSFAEDGQTVLTNVVSPVMINQGEAYVPAEEGMVLLPGDQLMAMEAGSAQLNFSNGCVYSMNSNELFRVSTDDACAMPADAGVNQAAPSSPGGGGSSTGSSLLGGGIAIAVGVAAAYSISDNMDGGNNERPPISP